MTDEQLQERLGNLIREINTQIFLMPFDRPDFGPSQIRAAEELVVGHVYRKHNKLYSFDFEFRGFSERGWINMRGVEAPQYTIDISPADNGLAPYEYGNWNGTNWIESLAPDPSIQAMQMGEVWIGDTGVFEAQSSSEAQALPADKEDSP